MTEQSLKELQSILRGKFKVRAEIYSPPICRKAPVSPACSPAIPRGTIAEIDEAKWRESWDLKVYGFINTCRAYLPKMAERRSGVINIIGNAGEKLNANYIVGSAGNASLIAFTKALGGA
jgi:NAD(P)-dependent dehydrogenase (short-subunit alcohol dehydrogenase family)